MLLTTFVALTCAHPARAQAASPSEAAASLASVAARATSSRSKAPPSQAGRWLATDEVFYQILVRSYRDSDGDRIGDLKGIQQSLDYLRKLGVTSLLLTPICPSPFYHNYFCTDFEGVYRAYGTRRGFEDLARAAHERGMKLYLDMEGQYVAQGHPWWAQSQGNPASEFSRYLIYHGPGNTKVATAVFEITGAPAYDGRNVGLTTVNLREPAVRAYFRRVFLSYIDPNGDGRFDDGVDGFRLDHMMDELDGKPELRNLFADFWAPIFSASRALNPRIRFVAEQADWMWGDDWLTRGGADMVFAFPLQRALAALNRDSIAAAITRMARQTPPGKGELVFIENHDVMRFASRVESEPRKERVGAALAVLLQGTPLLYYGQEIGMKGKQSSAWGWGWNDIPVREAMRWTRDEEAPGSAIWYAAPLDTAKGPSPWWAGRFNRPGDGVSVQEQESDPASLLSYYRRLLALRHARPELRLGDERVL
ncbi:MAG TPA: alpha-amylase family glycosyl hydrolase, partial [Longimicrobiales bacterium]